MTQKLRPGEVDTMSNTNGVAVIRWKDKGIVNMMSSVPAHFTLAKVATGREKRGQPVCKPPAVFDYNLAKKGVDVADQLISYYYVPRKGLKWFRKLAIHFLTGVCVANASVIVNQTCIEASLLRATELIARSLIGKGRPIIPPAPTPCCKAHPNSKGRHFVEKWQILRLLLSAG